MSVPLAAIVAAALSGIAAVALLTGHHRTDVLTRASPGRARMRPAGAALIPGAVMGAAAGAGLGWAFMGGGLSPWLGGGAGLVGALWLARRAPTRSAREQLEMTHDFPLVLSFLAAVVESGAPLRSAAAAVSLVADDQNGARLQRVLARCDVGFTDAEAWRALADDVLWGDVARELARCVDAGAAVAGVLRSAAERASKAQAADATARARAVGVSSTLPLVACFLPAFLLVGVVPIIGGLISGYMAGW